MSIPAPPEIKHFLERLKLLLEVNLDNLKNKSFQAEKNKILTAIKEKLKTMEVNLVNLLLKKIIDENNKSELILYYMYFKDYNLAFRYAVSTTDLDLVKTYLIVFREMLHINDSGPSGNTALHIAARNLDEPMVRLLLENGAFHSMPNKENLDTPLHTTFLQLTAENSNKVFRIVSLLCQYGAVGIHNNLKRKTPLGIYNEKLKNIPADLMPIITANLASTNVGTLYQKSIDEYKSLPSCLNNEKLKAFLSSDFTIYHHKHNDQEHLFDIPVRQSISGQIIGTPSTDVQGKKIIEFLTDSNIVHFLREELISLTQSYKDIPLEDLRRLYSLLPSQPNATNTLLIVGYKNMKNIIDYLDSMGSLETFFPNIRLVSQTSQEEKFFFTATLAKDSPIHNKLGTLKDSQSSTNEKQTYANGQIEILARKNCYSVLIKIIDDAQLKTLTETLRTAVTYTSEVLKHQA